MKVRHHKFRWALVGLWCALLSSTLVFAASLQAQASPTIAIVSPADGATVDGPVTLRITHSGIRFDGIRIGYAAEPGAGHWHASIGGRFAGLAVSNVIELPNDAYPVIPAGRQTIMVSLHQNDHAPLNPPVSQSINLNFAKEVRLATASAAQASIKLVNPSQSTVSIDAPLVVRIEHSGIRFDGLRSGKNPEPGTGHWHVNIDGRYAGLSVSNVLEIPNDSYPVIAPGQHTATVYLHQNNHAAVDPPLSLTFTINASSEVRVGTGAAQAATATRAATTATTSARTATPAGGRTATPAGRTATTAATTAATTGATVTADTTSTAAGGGPPIVQIPETGASGASLTPTFLAAIISITLGSMLMYLSRLSRVPATAGGLSLAGGSMLGGARTNTPWSGLAGTLRGRGLPRKLTSLSTNLGFLAGACFGIGLGSLVLGMTATTTNTVALAPAAPIVEPTTIAAPLALVPAAPTTIAAPLALVPAAPAPAAPQRPMLPIDGSLAWPAYVPTGMLFAPEESWPFQVVDAQQTLAPFLVFRDDTRWLLLRHEANVAAVLPYSAQVQKVRVGDAPASFVSYPEGGFTLTWQQDGTPIQLSGAGLSVDDVTAVAASLEPQSATNLQARLTMEAVHQQMNITALWPSTLPEGFELVPSASLAQFSQPGIDQGADSYEVTFRNGDAQILIGGGTVSPPSMGGTTERINAGNRTGTLTTSQNRFLLAIDADASGGSAQPAFPFGATAKLPLVQSGRVFVLADNLDRATFDQFVASLLPVRPQEFTARAYGQPTHELPYFWPGTLPAGYTLDLSSVRTSWQDYVLQGGRPYYELSATAADGAVVTVQGGGDAFLVPEGEDVEQVTARVHGQGATAVQTAEGVVVFWTEQGTFFTVKSSSLGLDEAIAFANSLKPISSSAFAERAR